MAKTEMLTASENFDASVDRWIEIYAHGANDRGWDDGANINLVRNHILYYQKIIIQEAEGQLFYDYPRYWGIEIPPKAPFCWMSQGSGERVPWYCDEEELVYGDSWGRLAYENLLNHNA